MNNENVYIVSRDGILDGLEDSANLVTSFLVERVATENQLAAHPVFGEFSFPVLVRAVVKNTQQELLKDHTSGSTSGTSTSRSTSMSNIKGYIYNSLHLYYGAVCLIPCTVVH